MAVTPGAAPAPEGGPETGPRAVRPARPGRDVPFRIDPRRTAGYRLARRIVWVVVRVWFRPKVAGRPGVPTEGPLILAPVHRSFADFVFTVFLTDRKLFFMAKDSLWRWRPLGRLLSVLGAFPVHRESADREALHRAEEVLRQGQVLVLFPEGTRREGSAVHELQEGTSFLAARTGSRVVPVGIGRSDLAMPKGRTIPKPLTISVVAGPVIAPPERAERARVSRRQVHQATTTLREALQQAYDQARG